MLAKMFKTKTGIMLLLISLAVFAFMLTLTSLTPISADDYSYSFNESTGERIESLADIVDFQIWHYFNWGGRSVAHTIAQTFLLIDKSFFNIINSIVYLAFIFLLYFHIKGCKENSIRLFLIVFFSSCVFNPVFGQTMVWLVGSCNYLWGMTFILLFLLPFRIYAERQFIYKNGILLPVMAFLGLIAGWCNENSSGTALLLSLAAIIMLKRKKIKIPIWFFSGTAGCAAGLAMMVLAPGNGKRAEHFNEDYNFFIKMSNRFAVASERLEAYISLIIIFVILFTLMILLKSDIQKIKMSAIFFVSAIICNYAMMVSPTYPERASTGVLVFLIISVGICLVSLNKKPVSQGIVILCPVMLVVFFFSFAPSVSDILQTKRALNQRYEYILSQKDIGNLNIKVKQIRLETKYNGIISDLTGNKDNWKNVAIANYYELESIVAE